MTKRMGRPTTHPEGKTKLCAISIPAALLGRLDDWIVKKNASLEPGEKKLNRSFILTHLLREAIKDEPQ